MTARPSTSLRFEPYARTLDVANVVVDGAPNRSTVLTLSHWPGMTQPPGIAADLSTEMVFRTLDRPVGHRPASIVTNDHFDQDGLAGMCALIDPGAALRHRALLVDVAAAGDFATYRHRSAARASMALWSYAQPERSPIGARLGVPYDQQCALLYEATIPLLVPMLTNPHRFEDLWLEEDERLTASESAIADGRVAVVERRDVDLAVVTVQDDRLGGGHRFGHDTSEFVHPMAVHNVTNCCRLLFVRGHDYLYVDRYETWVQYRSRALPRRVDLEPLARRLTEMETGRTTWTATPPSTLTPRLRPDSTSSLSVTTLTAEVIEHLGRAPAAWDPYRSNPSRPAAP